MYRQCTHCLVKNVFIIIIYLLKIIKVDNGYVNEQDRKAHCALTSAHNIMSTVEHKIHGICVTRNR